MRNYDYCPDAWVVLEISNNQETIHKILSSWVGGYARADSWRLSSGITKVEDCGDDYKVVNHSGSVYCCVKDFERSSLMIQSKINAWLEHADEFKSNLKQITMQELQEKMNAQPLHASTE